MNRFKDRLKSGDPLYGIFLGLAGPVAAEVSGPAGFDWLLIDNEHAANDLQSVFAQFSALARHDVDVLVRIRDRDPGHLKQFLDIGIQNYLVPMVDTAAQARALVEAVRYPPGGQRGVGALGARATNFGRDQSYFKTANDDICLMVQIETPEGLANMEEILAVDGVDAIFFGPSDIAATFGHIGQPGHPDVQKAILDGIARAKPSGKGIGVMTVDDTLIAKYRDAGANFLSIGLDTSLLAKATDALAQKWTR